MKKLLTWITIVAAVLLIAGGWMSYQALKPENQLDQATWLYINKNDNYSNIKHLLNSKFKYPQLFDVLSKEMNLPAHLYPGRYLLTPQMSMVDMIRTIRSGKSKPVKMRIKSDWTRDELIQVFADSLSCNQQDIRLELSSLAAKNDSFTTESVWSIFLADTYFFNWYTEGEDVVNRMHREFQNVFNGIDALPLDLNCTEVCILATIVQGETYRSDEMPVVARLYLNRLRINMPLQADPTIKFALQRDSVKRITHQDLEVLSPYNTYRSTGLPPGPISFPSKQAIRAVINSPNHNYLYMCAKEDFSGYHRFAANYQQHLRNARKYQRALNRKNIYR